MPGPKFYLGHAISTPPFSTPSRQCCVVCRVEDADCADKVVMLLNTVLESLVLGVLDPKVAQFEDMLKCLQVPSRR